MGKSRKTDCWLSGLSAGAAIHDLPIPPAWLCQVCPTDHCGIYGANNKSLRSNAITQIELGTDRNEFGGDFQMKILGTISERMTTLGTKMW